MTNTSMVRLITHLDCRRRKNCEQNVKNNSDRLKPELHTVWTCPLTTLCLIGVYPCAGSVQLIAVEIADFAGGKRHTNCAHPFLPALFAHHGDFFKLPEVMEIEFNVLP